jgi:hypothetical protein
MFEKSLLAAAYQNWLVVEGEKFHVHLESELLE